MRFVFRCASVVWLVTAGANQAFAQLAGGGFSDGSSFSGASPLRDTVDSLVGGPTTTTVRPWSFSGDLDVEVGAANSPGGTGGGLQPVILLAPDFFLTGTTSRLNAAISYSPRLAIYPSSSGQTLYSQSFNGSLNAIIVPDLLFVNLRGVSSVGSRFGDDSLLSTSFLSRSEAVQTTSFSFNPYLQRTVSGIGTLTGGYIYSQTFQDGDNRFNNIYVAPNAGQTAGFATTSNLQTNTEYATFSTDDNLGRIQESISATASQYSGDFYYDGASTYSVVDRLSYLVYRWLTVFGTVGYQDYRYPRSNYSLSEPTWTVGATLSPNDTSFLTLQYGQVAGVNTVLANGSYSPTARTRIYGSYSVDIQTGLGSRQALLNSTTVGPGGILVNTTTGAPNLINSYLASQYPLSRVKTLSIGAALLLDRDAFSVSVNHSEFDQLGTSTSVLGVATSSGTGTDVTYVSGNWQHELNPSTSLSTGISYAINNNGAYYGLPNTSQDTFQVYSSLRHVFTDTLSGSISASHAERFGDATRNLPAAFGGNASQTTFLVGLRKSF